jgi:hypothetical protein
MTKRKFLAIAAGGASLLTSSLLVERSQLQTLYRKMKGRLRKDHGPARPLLQRSAELPPDGERVSVELALNSRCSSDYDGDPDVFHWGMFDVAAQLSGDRISRIARLAGRCWLSQAGAGIEADNNVLTTFVDKTVGGNGRELCMIASGMQQQAVSLACAALGVGMMFNALGADGSEISSGKLATVQMRLDSMKPSYRGSFWTGSAPEKERPWLSGNLPDPRRDGTTPLVTILKKVSSERQEGAAATRDSISQLLWAARGRTPHLYKSTPWGLTIPTWQGLQNIAAVYAAAGSKICKYVNWQKGRPTHALEPIIADTALPSRLHDIFPPWNCFVILTTDDAYARGLWEVGYQLLNILVQASARGIACETIVLRDDHRAAFAGMPIEKPVALVALEAVEGRLP